MFPRRILAVAAILLLASSPALAGTFLVQVTTGPDNPSKAALAFTIAAAAQKAGNTVNVFLAGDGASLITDNAISTVVGSGTGKLQESFDALTQGGAHFYISGNSAKARNVTDADLAGKPAEFAMPAKFVELAAAADVVLIY
jgi:uncharacterized protein